MCLSVIHKEALFKIYESRILDTKGVLPLKDEITGRYSRQIMMKEIGIAGQKRLCGARVLVAGLGGLGSISSSYLAAAGVGRIRIVDCDTVDISNLNRQLLHWTRDLKRAKVESAAEKLTELNPECEIEAVSRRMDAESAMELCRGSDVIVDATDNLAARKALNMASVRLKIPFIHGAVGGLNGMVTSFLPGRGPCLECLFPADVVGAKVGILGPTAGIIASIQAMEVIKIIVGAGSSLVGRLLYLYGSDMRWKEITIAKNPSCAVCGRAD